ncbi:hypothetical protein J437_LFUL006856 [Ladona fulva]|uniref:PiggyBac transposable element-derived protein domain-containing protein n=1 Tax=Ladona fulva TaxID=123851 RepID=A0A8K0KKB6_LADFU|nr:hypothetical protein J437_LFUL006856 [Ladona fulva]
MRPRSDMRKWKDTDKSEIQKFLAVLFIMGINHLPNTHMYQNERICKTTTRARFEILLKCFHLNENNGAEKNDRLSKLRPLLELICNKFKTTLVPGESIVVDETLVPWRGRLMFRQYIPGKSHKYGVKLYKLCTPEGYTYGLKVYTGKEPASHKSGFGHGHDIVMELVDGLLDEERTVYMDNYFMSVPLCEKLLCRKTCLWNTA